MPNCAEVNSNCGDLELFCAAIKDNVVNAVDELYTAKRQSQDAAQCLIDVTLGSNMGAHAPILSTT